MKENFLAEIIRDGVKDSQKLISKIYVQSTNDTSSFLATVARLRFIEASFIQTGASYLGMDIKQIKVLVDAVQQSMLSTLYTAEALTEEEIRVIYPEFQKSEVNQEFNQETVLKAMQELMTSVTKLHS